MIKVVYMHLDKWAFVNKHILKNGLVFVNNNEDKAMHTCGFSMSQTSMLAPRARIYSKCFLWMFPIGVCGGSAGS